MYTWRSQLHVEWWMHPAFYITLHLAFSLSARLCLLERMFRLISRFLSRFRSSWKSSFTLVLVLAWCFHERAFPDVCLSFALLGLHLALGLIALVAHKHDGDVLHVTFDGQHLLVYGLQLLQRLPAGDGVDQDEGVAFGDGQTLHSRELVAASGVGDLQSAYALVTADDLPVCVLHRRDVGVPEGAFNEAQNQGALAHSPCSKHHHPVIVTLLWHAAWVCWGMWRLRLNYSLRSENGKRFHLVHMHIETVYPTMYLSSVVHKRREILEHF